MLDVPAYLGLFGSGFVIGSSPYLNNRHTHPVNMADARGDAHGAARGAARGDARGAAREDERAAARVAARCTAPRKNRNSLLNPSKSASMA